MGHSLRIPKTRYQARQWVELVGDYGCDVAIILERDDASQEARRARLSIRGSFEVLARIGPVAYKLKLTQELQNVHDTFHMSNLKKWLTDATLIVPFEEIQVNEKLHFVEELVEIMDREVKRLKESRIPIVKVRWSTRRVPEFTWERKDQTKQNTLTCSQDTRKTATSGKFRDEIPLTGG